MTPTARKSTSLTVRHTYRANPKRVFRAFTGAWELSKWYAPTGMSAEVDELEAREGGTFEITMKNDECAYTCYGSFLELVPDRRIVHTWQWRDEERAESTLVTIEIRPVEEGAEVVLTHSGFRDGEDANGHAEGRTETLEKLAQLLDNEKDRAGTTAEGD